MQKSGKGTNQFVLRDDLLVVAEFAGRLVKEPSQVNEALQSFLSSTSREIPCPFRGGKCTKVAGRPTGRPLPLCTVRLRDGSYIAVCHERIANEAVIKGLVREMGLETRHVLSNVKLPSGRSYDFLVLAHGNDRDDKPRLIFLEVITVDTTNTGSLLKAFMQSRDKQRIRHSMSINWENVRKREVVQMLYKDLIVKRIARVFNNIDVCYVGVIQRETFHRLFGDGSVYKAFDGFCSEYIGFDKSIGFLLFTMTEQGGRLAVRLENRDVAIVGLEKLIGAYPDIVDHDTRGLVQRLRRLVGSNAA